MEIFPPLLVYQICSILSRSMAKNLLNKEVTPEIKNVIDKNTILVIKYKEENKRRREYGSRC